MRGLLRLACTFLLVAGVACGNPSYAPGPVVTAVTPNVFVGSAGAQSGIANTMFVGLSITFTDDNPDEVVDGFDFNTEDATTEINILDEPINPASGSPVTIMTGIPVPTDDANEVVNYEFDLYGETTGLGAIFRDSVTLTAGAGSAQTP